MYYKMSFFLLNLKKDCSFVSPNVGRIVNVLPFCWLFSILNVNAEQSGLGYKCPETLANTTSVPAAKLKCDPKTPRS